MGASLCPAVVSLQCSAATAAARRRRLRVLVRAVAVRLVVLTGPAVRTRVACARPIAASRLSLQLQQGRTKTPVGRAAVGYARSRLQHGWTALRDVSQSASCAAKRRRAPLRAHPAQGSHTVRCAATAHALPGIPRDGKDGLLPLPAEFKRRPDELTARRGHREEPDGVWGAAARRGAHPETARVRRVGTRRPWSARVRHRRDRASTHRACSMACHAGTSPFAT